MCSVLELETVEAFSRTATAEETDFWVNFGYPYLLVDGMWDMKERSQQ